MNVVWSLMNDAQRRAILSRKAQEAIMKRRHEIQYIVMLLPGEERSKFVSLLTNMFIDGGKAAIETVRV